MSIAFEEDSVISPRRFNLLRSVDPTEVSGIGYVAEGCVFSNGYVALQWRDAKSIGFYESLDEMKRIHCHHDWTKVSWIDRDE